MKYFKLSLIGLMIAGLGLAAFGQSITVIAPNGGERWISGSTQDIAWIQTGVTGNVRINLLDATGRAVGSIATVPVTDGHYPWTVGQLTTGTAPTGDYLIGLYAPRQDVDGRSSAIFSIAEAERPVRTQLRLTAPNGGQTWFLGSPQTITWSYGGFLDSVLIRLDLYKDGMDEAHRFGTIASNIAIGSAGTGSYSWSPGVCQEGTATAGSNCYYVKVTCMEGAGPDFSDSAFSISAPIELNTMMQAQHFTPPATPAPTIEVPSPLAPLTISHRFTINWAARGVTGDLVINLLKESGGTFTIATGVDPGRATGHYTWKVGKLATAGSYLYMVEGERFRFQIGGRGVVGLSRWFEIRRPSLAVTEPHSGQRLRRGDHTTIRWSAPDLRDNVKIEAKYMHTDGLTFHTYQILAANARNTGHFDWTVWPRPRAGEADLDPPPTGDGIRWYIIITALDNHPLMITQSQSFIIE